jgi:hypothetical protein
MANYNASIGPNPPDGNLDLLPCVTADQAKDPAYALCINPGELCDDIDNNCDGRVDEAMTRCGFPLHCPSTEVCDGVDDDCDRLIDEGGVCPPGCVPSPEVCNSKDDDCDGWVDDGVANCGAPYPAPFQGGS